MAVTKLTRYQHTFTMGYGDKGKPHWERLLFCKSKIQIDGKQTSNDDVLKEALIVLEEKLKGRRRAA